MGNKEAQQPSSQENLDDIQKTSPLSMKTTPRKRAPNNKY